MATARVEVTGLREAQANLAKLANDVQVEIGREAMREAGWVLARPMRAATYTTFTRRTGAVRQGIGVAVRKDPADGMLSAWVTEHPQPIAGGNPFGALVRSRRFAKRRGRKPPPVNYLAFWWRFLEFGTGPRKALRRPKARSGARVERWRLSSSRGAILARSWLRPVFESTAAPAIEAFRATILKLIDAAVSAMPKK